MTTLEVTRNRTRLLPKGWRWARLGDVGQFDSGGTPPTGTATYWGGDIPFVTGADITDFLISSRHARHFLTPAGLRSGKTAVCLPGTVLIVTRTRVGRIGIAAELMGASQDLSPFICGPGAAPEYVCWYLRSIAPVLSDASRGSTIQGLTREAVRSLEVPLPPLPEQQRIAAILKEQMAAVEQARAACHARLEAARALPGAYLRAVFGGEEAGKWQKSPISSLSQTCSGSTPSRDRREYYGGGVPWVKTGELKDGIICDTEEHITEKALRETPVRLLPEGTVLVAMYGQGQTRGRTAMLGRPCTINQACFAILPNNKAFVPQFVQLWFMHNYSRLREATEYRGGNQPNLNGDVLRTQRIALPSLVEQQRLATTLQEQMVTAQAVMRSVEHELATINALPAVLLRRAFNGQL